MVSIGNVAIEVSDLMGSERFYTGGLGLEVMARIDTPDVHEVIVGAPGEGSQLMLAQHDSTVGGIEPSGIWKVFLFTDDVESLYATAIAAGAEPVEPPTVLDRLGITLAFVRDPDGYLLELGQRHLQERQEPGSR